MIIAADSAGASPNGPLALARHLRKCGQLTAGLVLRSLLSGHRALFEAALTELSGMPHERVIGYVRAFRQSGFAALYAKAGLPAGLLPAFRAALEAQQEVGPAMSRDAEGMLSRTMIERVLTAVSNFETVEVGQLLALLRRFEAEAAREDARRMTARLTEESRQVRQAPAVVIDFDALEAEIMEAPEPMLAA